MGSSNHKVDATTAQRAASSRSPGDARPRRPGGAAGRVALSLALCAAVIATAATATASALIVHLDGRALGYEPIAGAHANAGAAAPAGEGSGGKGPGKGSSGKGKLLEYHGGPVMPSNTNYALYWDPPGAGEFPAGYETGIDRYFEDLAHDSGGLQNVDSLLAQYTDSAGGSANYSSHFAGALIDSNPYPANGCSSAPICLTDVQLRAEIRRFLEANRLPMDIVHEYFLLTPAGVESCLEAAGKVCSAGAKHPGYCSFHSYIQVGSAVIVYASDPYVEGTNCDTGEEHPNGNASDATIGGGLAHEHAESVTDPELNAWYGSKEEEVGDKCRTFKQASEFGPPLGQAPDGANYNQVINGDLYWYQQMWSNEAGACEQRLAQAPTVTKLAPKSGPAAGGTLVTITGKGFSAPATVKFGAASATSVTVKSSTSITAVAPAGAVGTVDVTVTTGTATTAVTKKDRFKYKAR